MVCASPSTRSSSLITAMANGAFSEMWCAICKVKSSSSSTSTTWLRMPTASARWAVIGEGGFAGEHPRVAMIRRLCGRQLDLPLAYSTAYRHRSENPLRRLLIAMGALPTVVMFVALVCQAWDVARESLLLIVATYVTALLASSIALCTRLTVRGEEGEECKKSLRRLLRCSFRIF